MPFAIQTQQLKNSSEPANFDFSSYNAGNIQAVVYGISQLTLAIAKDVGGTYPYSGAQTAINNVEVSLTPQSGSGVGYTNLQIVPTIQITGDTGGYSNAYVTVLAYLGDSLPSGITLANPSIGGTPIDVSVPQACTGFLSGFSMSSNDSSSTLGMGAAASMVLSPYGAPSRPSAIALGNAINLVTNKTPMSTSVDVGGIVLESPGSDTGLLVGTSQVTQSTPSWVTATSDGLQAGGIFLQSFYLAFRVSSSVSPTPDFTAMTVGAPLLTQQGSWGFNPVMSLFSSYSGHSASGGSTGAGAYAASYSATYVWVGIP